MATLGRSAYSTIRKGAGIRNMGKGVLDLATSPLGALGIDIDPNYEGANADKWNKFSQIGDSLGKVAGGIGLGVATGGLGNLASAGINAGISGMQGSMQDMVPPVTSNIVKYGGKILTEYQGNTHEFGGIPIDANNEVEDKENSFDMKDGSKYIFSNSITMPNKKHTFAQGAKRIASKYKLRDGDAMAKTAQQRELEQLSQKQEFVKEIMKTPAQRMQEQMQQQFAMGGFIGDPPTGTPVTQATIDSNLIKTNALQPKQAIKTVSGSMRALPNGDWGDLKNLETPAYIPPTPEEIAKIMAEVEAQRLVQEGITPLNPMKRYGGRILHDGVSPGSTSFIENPLTKKYGKSQWQMPINYTIPTENTDSPYYSNPLTKSWGTKPAIIDPSKYKPANYDYTPGQDIGELPRPDMSTMSMRGLQSNPYKTLQRGTTPEYKQSMAEVTTKANTPASGYKPAYGIPMAGYGVQALSNLPALFAKPNKVKFDRIRPETIDLSAQRDEARRSRNLQLAMAQRQAGMTGDAGQAGAYANAASSNIMGNYGDAFNQSIMQQNNTNVGIRNQAQAQNAETQMREALVNQQELNSIREGKQQAVSNMGTIAAQAGKTYGQMNQEAGMMDWLNISNPDYGIKNEQYESALKQWLLGNKSTTPYKKKSVYGGKIRRTK